MVGASEKSKTREASQAVLGAVLPTGENVSDGERVVQQGVQQGVQRFISALRTSVFFQFVLLLSITMIVGVLSLPGILKSAQPEALDPDELMCKIPDFVESKKNYDVVFMGSSLVLAPAVYCDSDLLGKKVNGKDEKKANSHYYSKALYFEKLLGKAFQRDVSVYNLGLPGCMIADDCVLFEEILKSKKVPALVVVGVAPRDFMMQGFDPHNTPVQKALRKYKDKTGKVRESSTSSVLTGNLVDAPKAEIEKAQERLAMLKHLMGSGIDAMRRDPLGRKSREKEQAFEERKTSAPSEDTLKKDLLVYDERYNPPDFKMVDAHFQYLERLLKTAKDADVPIVIVRMPITGRNKMLLDSNLRSRYETGLQAACAKYGVKFLDFDSTREFKLADHSDSVHLNLSGGRKFYEHLTRELAAAPEISRRLTK